jgi:putative sugar O-methyltransferase
LLSQGERLFKQDVRYDLNGVTRGFREHPNQQCSDAVLLQRICKAYSLTIERQQAASAKYRPTPWWQQQRDLYLGPVMRALTSHDIGTLQRMYENFFRDDCSTGLIPVQRMKNSYLGEVITDYHRRLYLIDTLYRLDYWKAQTGSRYTLHDLAGPTTGNPFGVVLEDTLVRIGSEYQHYCAQRIAQLLQTGTAAVAEIGGGFGGVAYYLLRDRPETTYIGFDMPESIALTSYYLLKAFPQLNVVLYGEAELTATTISQADIVLMPIFEIAALPRGMVDLSFSSHAISDLSPELMTEYLMDVERITLRHFLYIGHGSSGNVIGRTSRAVRSPFTLVETRSSDWNRHVAPKADHVERLYHVERLLSAWNQGETES